MLPKKTPTTPPAVLLCRLVVLLLPLLVASSTTILLDEDLQLCVLGVSSAAPGVAPELETEVVEPRWRANLGEDEVKLANKARVLMSKTCILKCCGMPPSYPSAQSISNDDSVWFEMEQFLGGSGTPARNQKAVNR